MSPISSIFLQFSHRSALWLCCVLLEVAWHYDTKIDSRGVTLLYGTKKIDNFEDTSSKN